MNISRFFLLFLIAAANTCAAQEIAGPGWFNSAISITCSNTAVTNVAPGDGGGFLGGQTNFAEAITSDIQELANGLENDPKRIFDYVHDHIRHVLYFGAKKGAQLTLLERSGNDFDQCALLSALLQASGYSPTYEFGVLKMPYDSSDHQDVHHWLELTLSNTNWSNTGDYFMYVLGSRGYPDNGFFTFVGDTNTVGFHRIWVKVAINSTNYYLDPAFKISEPITSIIDLHSAMQLSTNDLVTAAGGTSTSDYAQSLSESALRNKLRDYTTNFLSSLQSNAPNASVEQILGGRQIVSSVNTPLSTSRPFTVHTAGGQLPLITWTFQPTNFMSKLSVTFASTNYLWLVPSIQGQRLSLTFDTNGLAQLWQEDNELLHVQTSGGSTVSLFLSVNHPHGSWNYASNTLTDTGNNDQTDYSGTAYQRTNATYILPCTFEMDSSWLRKRQEKLDTYRQVYGDSSRQVVSETLNVMGLTWLWQTELANRALARHADMLPQYHHRMGRFGQEKNKGYYFDSSFQLAGIVPASGHTVADVSRLYTTVDLMAYFSSSLEHGVIEQLQSGASGAASTVKMLQLGNTNGLKTFLLNSNNWSAVSAQLTNYDLNGLYYYVTNNFDLLLPSDGQRRVAGAGTWLGSGIVGIGFPVSGYRASAMLIPGGYLGGKASDPDATVDPPWVSVFDGSQPTYFNLGDSSTYGPIGGDPVNMTDGGFTVNATDLSLGQSEPRGLTFARHYSPSRRHHNLAGMAHGWIPNYYFNLGEISAADAGLGRTTPAQMAPMLVATRAAFELYNTTPNPKNWLMTALIAKWGVDQLLNNGVSITLANDTVQFVKQPDGSFTPPANSTMSLVKTNSAYNLMQRHANTFKFDSNKRLTNIVDQYSRSLKFTYNSSNWVTLATDWTNRTLTFNYTGSPLRLTSIVDSSNRSVTLGYSTTYNAQGDLVSASDPEGKTNTFIYDTNHQIIATKNAVGDTVVTNIFDDSGRVIKQYSQGDTNRAWNYFWSGFVNTEQDPSRAERRFFFDDNNREIAVQDALGNLSQTFYDGQGHITMTVSPLNETNQFLFDGYHNLTTTVDPLSSTNFLLYDNAFNLIATVDPRGSTNRMGYNSKFQLTGSTNAAGDWFTFAYSSTDGTLTSRTDSGGTTTYGYDAFGQVKSITYPNSLGSVGFLNNAFGDVLSHTNGRGFVTSFQYNQRRQLTNTIAPTNIIAKAAFDAVGNLLSTTDPRGFATTNTWSATRKLLTTTLPATGAGTAVEGLTYDSRDWIIRATNALSKTTQFTNDAAGRPFSVTDPLLHTSYSGYDANGRLTASTNANLEVTKSEWSAQGQLTRLTNPATNVVTRVYDPAGNQVTLTNRNGKRWQFYFDAANRLTNTSTPRGSETRLTFDDRGLLKTLRYPSTQTVTNFYDAKGRLTNRVDVVGSTVYRQDANNNLTNVVEAGKTNSWSFDAYDRVSSYRDADGNTFQYLYDASGNLTNLTYPGGKTVTYRYDSRNHLTNVTDWSSRQTTITYDLAGRVTNITRPNLTVRSISYDAAGRTTNIVEQTTSGAGIAFFKLGWTNAGRIISEFTAPLPHAYTPPGLPMTFDDDNRLATFNGSTITNDANGNMIWGPTTNTTLGSYTYDARNRLLSVSSFSTGYDPAGNRTSVINGTNVVRFVINPNAALSQILMRVQNGATNYYVYGLGLLYEADDAGNTKTYHYDYRGSTVAITDASGRVTDRIEYSAYGLTAYRSGSTDTPFLFNGRYGVQTDPSGLLYMRARYYNPYLCRFISADPAGFASGLNFYAFADGNPVSLLDPFGLNDIGASYFESFLNRVFNPVDEVFEANIDRFDYLMSGTSGWITPINAAATIFRVALEDTAMAINAGFDFGEELTGSPKGSWAMLPFLSWESKMAGGLAAESEIFYRTMSQAHYDQLLSTGILPSTAETFISPSLEYASTYNGVLVQFSVNAGTTESLLGIGVRNAGLSGGVFDSLQLVQRGWTSGSAFFKLEGDVVNIGLGRGAALNTFNNNIVNFNLVPKP